MWFLQLLDLDINRSAFIVSLVMLSALSLNARLSLPFQRADLLSKEIAVKASIMASIPWKISLVREM